MDHPLSIIYEDNHLLIIDKQAGVLVQGDKTNDVALLDICKGYIKEKYNKPGDVYLGLVHRLDRPVSGLVIFAKTSKALSRMNELFRNDDIKKTYWALVKNRPPAESGELVNWLKKDTSKNIVRVQTSGKKGAKKAMLNYNLLGRISDTYLLEVNLKTGRPHQIRVQLAKMGCPVVGDLKYGYAHANKDASLNLHAKTLSFIHPVKKDLLEVSARLPNNSKWNLYKSFEV